jgi:uncharacterized membrane protein YhhN
MRFPALFLLLLIGDLIARAMQPEMPYIEWLFKPALMLSLGLYFYQTTAGFKYGRMDKWIFAAISFSLLGDIALMFKGQFITGLLFFLTAHICYVIAFLAENKGWILGRMDRVGWALLAVSCGLGYFGYILPYLGAMVIPVGIYSIVIVTMFLTVLNRWKNVDDVSFQWVLAGAILFIISDGILAFNMFAQKVPLGSYLIMVTYAVGQYMIVIGYLKKSL